MGVFNEILSKIQHIINWIFFSIAIWKFENITVGNKYIILNYEIEDWNELENTKSNPAVYMAKMWATLTTAKNKFKTHNYDDAWLYLRMTKQYWFAYIEIRDNHFVRELM